MAELRETEWNSGRHGGDGHEQIISELFLEQIRFYPTLLLQFKLSFKINFRPSQKWAIQFGARTQKLHFVVQFTDDLPLSPVEKNYDFGCPVFGSI